ncbi:MAG: hypothetical protein IPJ88_08465 [Myxococcales bacterium]|nr:MAG: hypothetical protein IPJ88_08465 [Myxococcales bacterium]
MGNVETFVEYNWTVSTGLVLYYPFDGDASNQSNVDNPSNYDGTETTVSYVGGMKGQALKMDPNETDSKVDLANTSDVMSRAEAYTIALWFREDQVITGTNPGKFLIDFRSSTAGCESYHGASASLTTCCSGVDGSGTKVLSDCSSVSSTFMPEGAWHHLILRYAGTSTTYGDGADIEIYMDGILQTSIPNIDGALVFAGTQNDLTIGGATTNYYVDELEIHNRVYTDEEQCTQLIGGTWDGGGGGCTLPAPEPMLYYSFDNSTAVNEGGYGSAYDMDATTVNYVTGVSSMGMQFAGTGSVAATIYDTDLLFGTSDQYTIGLWVYEDSIVNGADLIDYRVHNTSSTNSGGCESYHGASGTAITTCCDGDDVYSDCQTFSFTAGQWHHVLYHYEGTSTNPGEGGPLLIYVDGVLAATFTNPDSEVIFSAHTLQDMVFGKDSATFIIDELKVYNYIFDEPSRCTEVMGGTWTGSACTYP